jgi:hypothetical protein
MLVTHCDTRITGLGRPRHIPRNGRQRDGALLCGARDDPYALLISDWAVSQ